MTPNDDRFRPAYHFFPPIGGINDPNGLVFFNEEWHLFYQHTPRGYVLPFATTGDDSVHRKHWGHAVSRDLVSWEHLPIALAPDELGAIWSGSCVVDEHDTTGFFDGDPGLVAIFTHFHREHEDGKSQSQSLAFSRDNGRTWTKYAGNPVLTGVAGDFRDPKVFWHEGVRRWVMVVTLGRCVGFYHSRDLKSWALVSRFGAGYGAQAGTWECPDLFPLGMDGDPDNVRWVLQISYVTPSVFRTRTGECGNEYFLGTFDGTTFVSANPPATVLHTSFGRDDYAAVSWENVPREDGRRILIGWMTNYLYHDDAALTRPGRLTLPRVLELRPFPAGVRLVQNPIIELQTLRREERVWQDVSLSSSEPLRVPDAGENYEFIAEFAIQDAREIGLRLRQNEQSSTVIGYHVQSQTLFIDRTHSGEMLDHQGFSGQSRTSLPIENSVLRLHIFVDSSSVEVFAENGRAYGSELIFPFADGIALEAYADGGAATLTRLTLFPLQVAKSEDFPL